ncbi:hypothetical protein BDF21DRAFT_334168 [Thamnidium elegans]|nr:hypothetical protein BDF21DRAFT_334168 [Thamnidium elegans]
MYLEWAERSYTKQENERDETSRQHQALLDLEQDEWSRNLTTILLSVGASETKQFFNLLDRYFLSSQHRLQIVYLLSEFMRRRYDNSTTLIAISVTNLIMLLPRICTSLPKFLPQLFYIFARAICWDQLRDLRKKQSSDAFAYTAPTRTIADGWDCVANEFKIPEEFDEETFKGRTIPQVKRHMLHPNLVVMDAESELTDKTRWMKMEPPDVIAQIMGLDLTNAASRVVYTVIDEDEEEHPDLLDQSLWDKENDNTIKPPATSTKEPITETDDDTKPIMITSIVALHKALKSGAEVLVGDDIWDAGVEPTTTANNTLEEQPTSSNSDISTETKLLLAALKREVLLLRNELNFELFLKQQHLQHIGRLHREHVLDSSVEAERQQLYNTTRMLKAQLGQTTAALEKLKVESALTKQKHVKWEDEQSGKLRGYREARREWQNQMTNTAHQVKDYENQLTEQKVQLDDARQKIFELENELKTLEPTLNKMTENEHRVKQLTQQMLLWEEDTTHMEEQKRYIKGLLSQWWSMEELVASLQTENRRLQEEQTQREESLEKLKVQCSEYHQKMESFSKTFNNDRASIETERLQTLMNELRLRLEELEIEKLEWSAQLEEHKFIAVEAQS